MFIQTINIINEAPVLDCTNLDQTISCTDGRGEDDLPKPTVTDDCSEEGEVSLTFVDDFTGLDECGDSGTFTRTWTATDDCGNESTTSATLTVVDNDPPTITVSPSDLSVECDGSGNVTDINTWLASNGGAIATDACSSITWTNDYSGLSNDCGGTGSATVTFTATDDCGNSETATGLIIIIDNTAPTIDVAASDLTISCDQTNQAAAISAWLTSNGGAIASDICGTVSWTNDYTDNLSDDCGLTGTVVVIFTATDDCGNETIETQTITVEDTTDPTLNGIPTNTTVECDAIPTAPVIGIGGVTASDNCDTSVTIVFSENIITQACGSTIERTWTATDDCGNTTSQTQTITVEDTTDPTLNGVPNNLTVECDAIPTAPVIGIGGVTASDNCDTSVTIIFSENIITQACGSTIERTWTATDDCGNTATTTGNFIIQDTTPPTIDSMAQPFMAECNGASNSAQILSWLNMNGGAMASDTCGGITWSNDYGSIDADCGTTGDVLVLDQSIHRPLTGYVAGEKKWVGKPVRVGPRQGYEVVEVLSD